VDLFKDRSASVALGISVNSSKLYCASEACCPAVVYVIAGDLHADEGTTSTDNASQIPAEDKLRDSSGSKTPLSPSVPSEQE
jgi:hypothetical protein